LGGAEREGRREGEIGITKGTNGKNGKNGGLWMCGGEGLGTGLRGFALGEEEGASWQLAPRGMVWVDTGLMGEGFGV
jgi:hypothetical protein